MIGRSHRAERADDVRAAAYDIFSAVLGRIDHENPAWDEVADALDALIGDCYYKRRDGSVGHLSRWRPSERGAS